jgi:hypothetical protein
VQAPIAISRSRRHFAKSMISVGNQPSALDVPLGETWYIPPQSPRSTGPPALFGLGLLILPGDLLDECAVQLGHLFCALAGEFLNVLPSIVLAACQALEVYALDHERLFVCFQMLVSSWPVLHFIVGLI